MAGSPGNDDAENLHFPLSKMAVYPASMMAGHPTEAARHDFSSALELVCTFERVVASGSS